MRNMIFLQALLCLCLNTVMAQSPGFRSFNTTSGTMSALQSMPTNAIVDDFGPRNLAKTYWHGGIDYNGFVGDGDNDKGYRLRAIVGGTIYAISTGSLKYIVIDGAEHNLQQLTPFRHRKLPDHR